ncbi:TPA: GNAT family N-acetyltransferase [Pseudomonas putida]
MPDICCCGDVGNRTLAIAINGQDLGNNPAHLRWFILDDGCRGSGVGRQLLSAAVEFCDQQGFDAISGAAW